MRHALFAVSALATVLAAAPLGAEPVVLKPYGPWNVDFGEDTCRLQRLFGTAEDKQLLLLQQYWPDDRAGLTVAGSAFKRFRTRDRTDLSFFEGQEPVRATGFSGTYDGIGDAVIFSNVPLENRTAPAEGEDEQRAAFRQMDLAFGKKARFVEVRQGNQQVRFATGSLDQAFEVLNQCTLEQLRAVGLDAEKHVTMQSAPRWVNREALVRRIIADYPLQARASGEQGVMRMRVIVGANGAMESCHIIKATTTQQLESGACEVMKRAQFEPARDAEGKPFRALYATSLVYRMP